MKLNYEIRPQDLNYVRILETRTKIMKLLDEFLESDQAAARVDYLPEEYSSASSAFGTISKSIKRFGYSNDIRIITRLNKVYLLRITEKEES